MKEERFQTMMNIPSILTPKEQLGRSGEDRQHLPSERVRGRRRELHPCGNILESMLGTEDWIILGSKSHITADLMIKAMMAVKLARHAHKRKRDNLVDLCGYAELLSRVQRL